ncbi:hypothetical protein HK104_000261 [Borealophlyctis nickersoniae]|nr:hypothetical protein HK104_000261 [Borealophlyctis nickersoniae]
MPPQTRSANVHSVSNISSNGKASKSKRSSDEPPRPRGRPPKKQITETNGVPVCIEAKESSRRVVRREKDQKQRDVLVNGQRIGVKKPENCRTNADVDDINARLKPAPLPIAAKVILKVSSTKIPTPKHVPAVGNPADSDVHSLPAKNSFASKTDARETEPRGSASGVCILLANDGKDIRGAGKTAERGPLSTKPRGDAYFGIEHEEGEDSGVSVRGRQNNRTGIGYSNCIPQSIEAQNRAHPSKTPFSGSNGTMESGRVPSAVPQLAERRDASVTDLQESLKTIVAQLYDQGYSSVVAGNRAIAVPRVQSVVPAKGEAALAHLLYPEHADVILYIKSHSTPTPLREFRAHLVYLQRSPFFADLTPTSPTVDVFPPNPHLFLHTLEYIYTWTLKDLYFVPTRILSILRNATFLRLSELVQVCRQRFADVWGAVVAEDPDFHFSKFEMEEMVALVSVVQESGKVSKAELLDGLLVWAREWPEGWDQLTRLRGLMKRLFGGMEDVGGWCSPVELRDMMVKHGKVLEKAVEVKQILEALARVVEAKDGTAIA